MTSRYDSKNAARMRAENESRNKVASPRARDVPRWVKKYINQVLSGNVRGGRMMFSEKFLPGNTVEVIWQSEVPRGLLRTLRIFKTTYRLQHRLATKDDLVFRNRRWSWKSGISNGFSGGPLIDIYGLGFAA